MSGGSIKPKMDYQAYNVLFGVTAFSLTIIVVACMRVIWTKILQGQAEEARCHDIPPINDVFVIPQSTIIDINSFPRSTSPTTLPSYREALLNAAILRFVKEDKAVQNEAASPPPEYPSSSESTPPDSMNAPPSYHTRNNPNRIC